MDSFLLAIIPVSIGMCGKKTDVRTLCACAKCQLEGKLHVVVTGPWGEGCMGSGSEQGS